MRRVISLSLALAAGSGLGQAQAQTPEEEGPEDQDAGAPERADAPSGVEFAPFGANLFEGNYARQREDGLSPDYRILPGDRVSVNIWGSTAINDVFIVDGQGNIFLPEIGPVALGGVRNADLTDAVRTAVQRVYRGTFGVYTNLLTASPVAIYVTGGVLRPGRYAGIPSDSLLFYLAQAGGIDPDAGSYRDIRVLRGTQAVGALDLYDFLLEGQLPSIQLADGDTILVTRRGPTVRVRGWRDPVRVELKGDALRGEDILRVLGAPTRINEVLVRGARDGRPMIRSLPLASFQTQPLQDGDELLFREDGRPEQLLVHLEGEHEGPSILAVRRGTRLLDLLNHVAVDPQLALPRAVHLQRRQVAEQQRQMIRDSLDRLERSAVLALSGSTGEAEIRVREAELVRAFVERAREAEPLGRVVTSTAGQQINVLLQDGDTIVIPQRTNVVQIGGEVRVTQAAMYRPDLEVRDYVRMAGGYSNRAETDAVILIRPDASVSIGPPDMPVGPGDQILVPPRIDRKVFQHAIDISRILYEIAIATSVLFRVF